MRDFIIETICFVILGTAVFAMFARADEVNDYVSWFTRPTPRRMQVAQEHVEKVKAISGEIGVDPLLVAVIVSCESSWRMEARGTKGERGLMQVHGVAARGFDLSNAEGQIRAGVTWLKRGIEACGLNARALAWYNGEGCVDRAYAKRRWLLYQNAIRAFRL